MGLGLICCCGSGTIDSVLGNPILSAQVVVLASSQINEIIVRVDESVDAAINAIVIKVICN